ncbi:hypothetical protein [Mesorhizobium sp. YM1C-6-2]|uniref:hypothetical protein n=1 Tax=Mesorhizobium sp. YM1C-6-2 TaxID=1827501 RepID=UPI001FDF3AC7|nr:hypothetical protein [Mesorhizobium sp. YM1C-6-2]
MIDLRVKALCEEFEIEVIGKSRYPEPGQTRSPETINRILRKYGEEHARLALTTLRETANNHVLLDEVGLWCASDMIRARPDVVEKQAGEWLALWDQMPVGQLQAIAQTVSGVLPVRYVLDGMLLERIQGRFGDRFVEPDLFDDRRRIA